MAQGAKIPVTVITGLLGSGKTTLLNRFLLPSSSGAAPAVAVLISEPGVVALNHKLVRHVGGNLSVMALGCTCCSVSGELVDTLRELFMAALHRKIPVFSRVLIEMAGMADPVPVMHTLKYQVFLRERYAYDGSICVIDAERGPEQLRLQPQALQQAALADSLVIGKAELVAQDTLEHIEQAVRAVNLRAPVYSSLTLPPLDEVLSKAAPSIELRREQSLFSG